MKPRYDSESAFWNGKVREIEADAQTGHYYVTAKNDRGQTAFLLGPFTQKTLGKQAHCRALGAVRKARRYCDDHGLNNFNELRFGTARIPLMGVKLPKAKLEGLV